MAVKQIHIQAPTLLSYASVITILFILTIIITISWPAAPLSFNYHEFNDSFVKLDGDASIQSHSEQITANGVYQQMNGSVGRVTNLEPMPLWDKSSRRLTDFTTEFTFQIYTEGNIFGDGMTFFLADPDLPFNKTLTAGNGLGIAPADPDLLFDKTLTAGNGLGIAPSAIHPNQMLNSSKYQFVAVEFDTYKNWFDPTYAGSEHVGIDINSIVSNTTRPWDVNISNTEMIYHAKIDYNSSTHNLSVTFGESKTEEVMHFLWYQVDLRNFLPELVSVGFSASTGDCTEVHNLKLWSLNSTLQIDENAPSPTPTVAASPHPSPKKGSKIGLWVELGIGLCFLVCFIGSVWFLLWKKEASREEEFVFDLEIERGTGPSRFSYKELVRATKDFADAKKLGQGAFGVVYRGFLNNSDVAIKKLSRGSEQGPKEYASEVKVISQLRHKNLVKFIGWCHQKSNLLLIYEFMPNCSLDFHLFEEHNFLTWQVRYNIAQGLASTLLYLQELWEQCVLHRDIKSSNIMLDSDFNAKLGDFGLARLVDHKIGSQITDAAGTPGYVAPEYHNTGKASKESDIFSFGVVVLEIACGRKPIDPTAKEGQVRMVEWVWELYGKGKILEAADPKLRGEFDIQQMEHLMVVGLWCAHPDYMLRPLISQAIRVLNSEDPLPVLPEKMPVPTYLPPPSTRFEIENNGANAFEIENNGTQSSQNSGYTSSCQFASSSTGSASAAHWHTH